MPMKFKLPKMKLTTAQLEAFMRRTLGSKPNTFNKELIQGNGIRGQMESGSFKVPAPEDPLVAQFNQTQEMLGAARLDPKLTPLGDPMLDQTRLQMMASDLATGKTERMPSFANRQLPGSSMPTRAFPPTRQFQGPSGLSQIAENQPGSAGVDAAFQSPVDQLMARFYKQHPSIPGERIPVDMPWEEGRQIWKNENRLKEFIGTLKGALPDVIKTSRTEGGSVDDITGNMALGIAQKRLKYAPVFDKTDLADMRRGKSVSGTSSVGEKRSVRQAFADEPVVGGKIKDPEVQKVITEVDQALELWHKIGGKRGVEGKMWKNYNLSRQPKQQMKDEKEYFVRGVLNYKKDPTSFAKSHPREARAIERLWKEYME